MSNNGWKKELPRDKYREFLSGALFHEGKDSGAALVRSDEVCTKFHLDGDMFVAVVEKVAGSAHESRTRTLIAELDGGRWKVVTHKVNRVLDPTKYESRTGGATDGHKAVYGKPDHVGGPVEAPAWTFRRGNNGKAAETFPIDDRRKAQQLGVAKADFQVRLGVVAVG